MAVEEFAQTDVDNSDLSLIPQLAVMKNRSNFFVPPKLNT
jgi:hypothetical protein